MRLKVGLILFIFIFFQKIFCESAVCCCENLYNGTIYAPMDIDQEGEPCEPCLNEEVCDVIMKDAGASSVECEKDYDGDLIMINTAYSNQNETAETQQRAVYEKLAIKEWIEQCVNYLRENNVDEEASGKVIDCLLGNLCLIEQNGLIDWLCNLLEINRLHGVVEIICNNLDEDI